MFSPCSVFAADKCMEGQREGTRWKFNLPPSSLLDERRVPGSDAAAATDTVGALETLPPTWRLRRLAEAVGTSRSRAWCCIVTLIGCLKDAGGWLAGRQGKVNCEVDGY